MHLTLLWSPPVTSRAATDTENASNWERLPRRDEFSPALRGLLASVAEDAKASSACDAQRLVPFILWDFFSLSEPNGARSGQVWWARLARQQNSSRRALCSGRRALWCLRAIGTRSVNSIRAQRERPVIPCSLPQLLCLTAASCSGCCKSTCRQRASRSNQQESRAPSTAS